MEAYDFEADSNWKSIERDIIRSVPRAQVYAAIERQRRKYYKREIVDLKTFAYVFRIRCLMRRRRKWLRIGQGL